MDGENNGKPYFLMDDLGVKPTIFGNIHMYVMYVSPTRSMGLLKNHLCTIEIIPSFLQDNIPAPWIFIRKNRALFKIVFQSSPSIDQWHLASKARSLHKLGVFHPNKNLQVGGWLYKSLNIFPRKNEVLVGNCKIMFILKNQIAWWIKL